MWIVLKMVRSTREACVCFGRIIFKLLLLPFLSTILPVTLLMQLVTMDGISMVFMRI